MSNCSWWTGRVGSHGYGLVRCVKGSDTMAHRVAWSLANHRDIPEGCVIMHSCDNKLCINPEHLLVGTQADNMADKVVKKRQARGVDLCNSPLNDSAVREIRSLRAAGLQYREIGLRFGVSGATVGNIVNGKTWSHVKGVQHEPVNEAPRSTVPGSRHPEEQG